MLKRLRKNIIFLFCLCILFSPVCFGLSENELAKVEKPPIELIQKDVKVNDLDIEPINTKKVKDGVVPNTKQEGKKVLQLFLKTMLAVAISAILLNVILIFVKRFYGSAFVSQDYDDYEELDLTTPNTKQDALKAFLNRTK